MTQQIRSRRTEMVHSDCRVTTKRQTARWCLACAFAVGLTAALGRIAHATETIQLAPFLVHAKFEGTTEIGTQPISVRLDVLNNEWADYICKIYPRLRDAVVRYLSPRQFVLTKGGDLLTKGIEDQLRQVITGTLKTDALEKVHVIHGSYQLPSVIAARLSQTGCLRIEGDTAKTQ